MLSGKVYVVTSPELVNSINRNSKVLAFNPFIAQVGKRITSHDDATGRIIQHNLNGESGPGYVTEIHDGTVAALGDPSSVEKIISVMLQESMPYLDRLEPEIEMDFFLWLRRTVTRCTTTAIYGPGNPLARDAEKLDDAFWDFDNDLNLLILDLFPSIIASKAHRARLALTNGFQHYFQKYTPNQTECSSMTHSRRSINAKYSLTPSNAARLEVGALLGVLANIVPTIFYTVMHIFSSLELLRSIREELEATCIHRSPDGKTRTLKVLAMREKCNLLHATFKETLRHHALGTSVRYVREDMLLDDKYLLKKGSVVQTPMAVLHKSPAAWGEDAAAFRPSRFLKVTNGAEKELKQTPAAFRPFGGGASLCPGRHVATMETMALAVMLVLRFEIEGVNGALVVPGSKQKSLATNVFPPEKDVRVRITNRQGHGDVRWGFVMG
ncbi:MAG: hypothetical protein Q9195_008132 [Heterodermia aff. obscurata]